MTMKNETFSVNAPGVVSEVIDGELVIMDLQSGNYFSAEKSGLLFWSWVEKGYGLQDIVSLANSHFTGISDGLEEDLRGFIAKLLEYKLVVAAGEKDTSEDLPAPEGEAQPYAAPAMNVYTDMKDMLLLDPIHDVDEAGWPMAKTD